MKPRSIIGVVVLALVVGGGLYAWKEYNRPVQGADALVAKESLSAADLLSAFQVDEVAATAKYVGTTDQAINVRGTIRGMEPADGGKVNVTLETGDALAGVVCEFAEADVPMDWRAGARVGVKGICTGMLLDVVLVRCAAVE